MQKGFGGVADATDGVSVWRGQEPGAGFGEVGDHLRAGGGVVEQRAQRGGEVGGGEALVEQLGDDAAAGDEVDHGDGQVAVGVGLGRNLGGIADQAFEDGVR